MTGKSTDFSAELSERRDLVELHNHLSTSTSAHMLWQIAHEQGIRLPTKKYDDFIDVVQLKGKTSPERYHEYFDLIQMIQSSPLAIERSVHEAVSLSYRKSGIGLLEVKFNPMKRNRKGLFDLDRIMFNAYVGMRRAMMEYPIQVGLIIEADARMTMQENEIIINKAIDFKNDGVVGIDISGLIHKEFSFKPFKPLYEKAKAAGLGTTVHCGELGGADQVWEAINELEPDRIGHGIRSIDDPKLLKELKKRGVVLEICPTSNVLIGAVKDWFEMGTTIRKIADSEVKFTICADNPVLLQTNLLNELLEVYSRDILSMEEIETTIETARANSFIKLTN